MLAPQLMNDRCALPTVVVTGGVGYVGSLLVRRLLARGYRVRVLDCLLYGGEAIQEMLDHPHLELVVSDFRQADSVASAIEGSDAVIHLGAIVGDPACALDERLAVETNLEATRTIADACKIHGVRRLVFASTCSVYGASENVVDETSPLNPVSLYADTKIAAEAALLERWDDAFAPVILRFGTAYGASLRPRFDLVVNLLTAQASVDGYITIHGGEQRRPFVHVDDMGRALILALEAPIDQVAGQIFNVGSNQQNRRLLEIGEAVREVIPAVRITVNPHDVDRRDYCVRFDKIQAVLGFQPSHDLVDGIREMKAAFESGLVGDHQMSKYHNHLVLREAFSIEQFVSAAD